MNSQPATAIRIQRGAQKFVKRAATKAVIKESDDSHHAPLASSDTLEILAACIRARAHELYEQRGAQEGHDLDDWLQAEREVLASQPAAIM